MNEKGEATLPELTTCGCSAILIGLFIWFLVWFIPKIGQWIFDLIDHIKA